MLGPMTVFWGGCLLLLPALALQPFIGPFKELPTSTQRVLVACAGAITVAGLVIYHLKWARLLRRCAVRVYDRGLEIDGIVRFHVERLSARFLDIEQLQWGVEVWNWLDRLGQAGLASEVKGSRLTVRLHDGSAFRFDLFRAYYSEEDLGRFLKELTRTGWEDTTHAA